VFGLAVAVGVEVDSVGKGHELGAVVIEIDDHRRHQAGRLRLSADAFGGAPPCQRR